MKKLIVPFLFCNKSDLRGYAWIFCKYADFSLRNDMPFIVEEEYCNDSELITQYNQGLNPRHFRYTVQSPIQEDIDNRLKKVLITKEEKGDLLISQKRKKLCLEEDVNFEILIKKKFDEIEEKYGEIGIILTWIRYPALVKVCSKRNILIITQELSSIRGNDYYEEVLGYFNFGEKYTTERVMHEFKSIEGRLSQEVVLNRKDILALVLQTVHLDVLNRLEEPIYEFGVDAEPGRDIFFEKYGSGITEKEIESQLDSLTDSTNILARYHPSHRMKESECRYDIDDSINSMEWILKCRRIVSVVSNVGFEAMLLGRTSYVLSEKTPYYIGNAHSLEKIEEKISDLRLLNYLLFAYYTPWELMFNPEYIYWRSKMPNVQDIYRYNLSYLFSKSGLEYEAMSAKNSVQRFQDILKYKHDFSEEQIKEFIKRKRDMPYTDMEKHYQKQIEELCLLKDKEINFLLCKIQELQTSTSWKMTKPLRSLAREFRKIKKHIK